MDTAAAESGDTRGLDSAGDSEELSLTPSFTLHPVDLLNDPPCWVCLGIGSYGWCGRGTSAQGCVDNILLCDGCQGATHTACWGLPPTIVDATEWFCDACLAVRTEGIARPKCQVCQHGTRYGLMRRLAGGRGFVHPVCYRTLPGARWNVDERILAHSHRGDVQFYRAGDGLPVAPLEKVRTAGPCLICKGVNGVVIQCGALARHAAAGRPPEQCSYTLHAVCAAMQGAIFETSGAKPFAHMVATCPQHSCNSLRHIAEHYQRGEQHKVQEECQEEEDDDYRPPLPLGAGPGARHVHEARALAACRHLGYAGVESRVAKMWLASGLFRVKEEANPSDTPTLAQARPWKVRCSFAGHVPDTEEQRPRATFCGLADIPKHIPREVRCVGRPVTLGTFVRVALESGASRCGNMYAYNYTAEYQPRGSQPSDYINRVVPLLSAAARSAGVGTGASTAQQQSFNLDSVVGFFLVTGDIQFLLIRHGTAASVICPRLFEFNVEGGDKTPRPLFSLFRPTFQQTVPTRTRLFCPPADILAGIAERTSTAGSLLPSAEYDMVFPAVSPEFAAQQRAERETWRETWSDEDSVSVSFGDGPGPDGLPVYTVHARRWMAEVLPRAELRRQLLREELVLGTRLDAVGERITHDIRRERREREMRARSPSGLPPARHGHHHADPFNEPRTLDSARPGPRLAREHRESESEAQHSDGLYQSLLLTRAGQQASDESDSSFDISGSISEAEQRRLDRFEQEAKRHPHPGEPPASPVQPQQAAGQHATLTVLVPDFVQTADSELATIPPSLNLAAVVEELAGLWDIAIHESLVEVSQGLLAPHYPGEGVRRVTFVDDVSQVEGGLQGVNLVLIAREAFLHYANTNLAMRVSRTPGAGVLVPLSVLIRLMRPKSKKRGGFFSYTVYDDEADVVAALNSFDPLCTSATGLVAPLDPAGPLVLVVVSAACEFRGRMRQWVFSEVPVSLYGKRLVVAMLGSGWPDKDETRHPNAPIGISITLGDRRPAGAGRRRAYGLPHHLSLEQVLVGEHLSFPFEPRMVSASTRDDSGGGPPTRSFNEAFAVLQYLLSHPSVGRSSVHGERAAYCSAIIYTTETPFSAKEDVAAGTHGAFTIPALFVGPKSIYSCITKDPEPRTVTSFITQKLEQLR